VRWLVEATLVALTAILLANAHLIYEITSGLSTTWDTAPDYVVDNYYFYVDYCLNAANALWALSGWIWLRRYTHLPRSVSIIILAVGTQYVLDAYSTFLPINYESIPIMLSCLAVAIIFAWVAHISMEFRIVRKRTGGKIGFIRYL